MRSVAKYYLPKTNMQYKPFERTVQRAHQNEAHNKIKQLLR